MENIKFNKSFLMSGRDFPLTESIKLKHPSCSDIISLNDGLYCEDVYFSYVNTLLSDPYTKMVELDDLGLNYLDVTPFELFIIEWKRCLRDYEENKETYDTLSTHPLDAIKKALDFFLGVSDFELGKYDETNYCIYDPNNQTCQIDKDLFEYIRQWIISINCLKFDGRIIPADETARMILLEDMRDELKKQKRKAKQGLLKNEPVDTIGRLMSAVSFGGNGSINPFNIMDAKVFWLFESFNIINKRDSTNHIFTGIYSGTVNSDKLNKKELDWTN